MSIFGDITMFGEGRGAYSAKIDRLALDGDGQLMLASVLGDQRIVRGMGASLCNNGATMNIRLSGIRLGPDGADEVDGAKRTPEPHYELRFAKLPYGQAHAIFMSKKPGFLPATTEAHLWRELSGPRFTTPLLRGWMPFVIAQLRKRELLIDARCYRCPSGLLVARTDDLDAIVSDGVRQGDLKIDEGIEAANMPPIESLLTIRDAKRAAWRRLASKPGRTMKLSELHCITETADALVAAGLASKEPGGYRCRLGGRALDDTRAWFHLFSDRTTVTTTGIVTARAGDGPLHYCRLSVFTTGSTMEVLPVIGFPMVNSTPLDPKRAAREGWRLESARPEDAAKFRAAGFFTIAIADVA